MTYIPLALRDVKTVAYEHNNRRIDWKVNKTWKEENNKSPMDIMMENGYHPAGYGAPFNESEDENYYYFQSWNSCD